MLLSNFNSLRARNTRQDLERENKWDNLHLICSGPEGADSQRIDGADSGLAGEEFDGLNGRRRNFELPAGAIGTFIFHPEG